MSLFFGFCFPLGLTHAVYWTWEKQQTPYIYKGALTTSLFLIITIMQTPPTPEPNPSVDLSSLDVTQLRAAHYQLHYPSPSFLTLHHAPWTDMVVNMYRDFLNKVSTTAKLEEETRGSLYRVCATKAPLPYRASMIDR